MVLLWGPGWGAQSPFLLKVQVFPPRVPPGLLRPTPVPHPPPLQPRLGSLGCQTESRWAPGPRLSAVPPRTPRPPHCSLFQNHLSRAPGAIPCSGALRHTPA